MAFRSEIAAFTGILPNETVCWRPRRSTAGILRHALRKGWALASGLALESASESRLVLELV